ncbi:oligosaccharide flippase family protein [Virgibacillus halodenitrificans]|uniref:oligosaccharide flippase family protein n=1 Tax=Virgibacillus halodenitrificans TaxID=1482 RepID=UPI002DBA59C2|nr:oligosaccharide flippase family protein [Virgibacillus halodenitrificans]MEC2159773.1 oligosaccharide flippase family protein [Virgibacillus halodenitrificans]
MSNFKKLLKLPVLSSIFSFGSATLISSALSFVLGIVSRNILGPEQYGYWVSLSMAFTFIPLLQLGVLNAMNREIPYYFARNSIEEVNQIRQKTFSYLITFPTFIMLLLLLISIFTYNSNVASEYKIGLIFISFIGMLLFLSAYVEMYYKSIQDFKNASKLIVVKGVTQSLLSIIFILQHGFIGLFLGVMVALIIEILMGRQAFKKMKFVFDFRLQNYVPLIKIGFPILMVGLIWSVLIATDKIILTIMMDSSALGNYSVALLVFSSMMLLPQVISQVYYPKIVTMVSKEEHQQIKQSYKRVNLVLLVISVLIVAFGLLLLPSVIRLLMPEYEAGVVSAQILSVGLIPLTLVNYSANYFNATHNQKLYIKILLLCIVVNILVSTILLLIFPDISMVAIGTSVSFFLYFILMNTFFWVIIRKVK